MSGCLGPSVVRHVCSVNRLANVGLILVAIAIALAGLEFLLRVTGHHPYRAPVVAAASLATQSSGPLRDTDREPANPPRAAQRVAVPPHEEDGELGYRPKPGHYIVAPPGLRPFSVTIDANSRRITHAGGDSARARQAWFFGCSFTYGWGLDDEQTFAWKIRQASNDLDVVNFAASGYGNVHGLLQFRRALQAGHRPKFAAIVYASFHDERNALLRFYRKDHIGRHIFPYARLAAGKLVTVIEPVEYTPWPLQQELATVEFAEHAYNRNEDWLFGSQQVTKAVLREFMSLASAHSIPVVVFGIWNNERTREVVSYAKTIGAIAADVSEDLEQPGAKVEGDSHPSAATNDRYAQKMLAVLRQNHLQ